MHIIIEGTVVSGNKIGSKLGFPTANIAMTDDMAVENGVYAATVVTEYGKFDAMVNVGTRPTVTKSTRRWLEVNLFEFNKDLYGQKIVIELLYYVRGEKTFGSVEELKAQIDRDKTQILKMLQHEN